MRRGLLILVAVLLARLAPAWTNGFNKPYIGWMGYCYYHETVTATIISNAAFHLTTNGMKNPSHDTYVILDAYWSDATTNALGVPVPVPAKFPNGMGPVVDYIHSLGLKAGIYCQGLPWQGVSPYNECVGGYETNAVNQFAAWGFDYLMVDFPNTDHQAQLTYFRNAIQLCGREMYLCTDHIGTEAYMPALVNTCRTTADPDGSWTQVLAAMDDYNTQSTYAELGFWPDPSVLQIEVGPAYGGGQTYDQTTNEFRSQFMVWCVMGANLTVSTDLSQLSAMSLCLLTNAELIAVNQDARLAVGTRKAHTSGTGGYKDVWAKPLSNGGTAVACMNGTSGTTTFTLDFGTLGYPGFAANVRDLLSHSDLGAYTNTFTTGNVSSHDSLAFELRPIAQAGARLGAVVMGAGNFR